MNNHGDALAGCLAGGALGDALGLAYEGISPRRQARMRRGALRFAVVPGVAVVSDDTEHAALTVQALMACGGDPNQFERALAKRLRYWIAALPPGVGLATGRALWKLWLGFTPGKNGVHSAGNGPAMRAAIIGAYFANDPKSLLDFTARSARLTHLDARAQAGAQLLALAAALSAQGELDCGHIGPAIATTLAGDALGMADFRAVLAQVVESVERGDSTPQFCEQQGWSRGVQGYIVHSVAASLHAALRHPNDLRLALQEIIDCGGDCDSTAAIVGGIVGARVGMEAIDPTWLSALRDWPWGASQLQVLGHRLAEHQTVDLPFPFWPAVLLRNLAMLLVVLIHGFRRLLPPY